METSTSGKTEEQLSKEGLYAFEKFKQLRGGYFSNMDGTMFYQINGLRFDGADYHAYGLGLTVAESNGQNMYEANETATLSVSDNVICIEESTFKEKFQTVVNKFAEAFNDVSQRGYLFKFDDGEGRPYEQVVPYILGAQRGNFCVSFYYAPDATSFRVVRIRPEDIQVEQTMGGDTKLKSFSYTEDAMVIEGNPFSSNTRNMRLYKFPGAATDSIAGLPFDKSAIYMISEWHYDQIRQIIVGNTGMKLKGLSPI